MSLCGASQYAFRKHGPTESALVKMQCSFVPQYDWLCCCENGLLGTLEGFWPCPVKSAPCPIVQLWCKLEVLFMVKKLLVKPTSTGKAEWHFWPYLARTLLRSIGFYSRSPFVCLFHWLLVCFSRITNCSVCLWCYIYWTNSHVSEYLTARSRMGW